MPAGNCSLPRNSEQLLMTYTGPGRSKQQTKENAQQLRADLIKANLWPQSSPTDLMQITYQYQGLPEWLKQPPATPEPGQGTALHELLICP